MLNPPPSPVLGALYPASLTLRFAPVRCNSIALCLHPAKAPRLPEDHSSSNCCLIKTGVALAAPHAADPLPKPPGCRKEARLLRTELYTGITDEGM